MELKTEHQPYAPASATNVQRIWKKYGWVAPSKDPLILDKWAYYKSIAFLSAVEFKLGKEPE